MIDILGKHQVSLFLPAEDIGPTPDNISNLLKTYSDLELLPDTFQEVGPQGITPIPRLRLKNPNGEWSIRFASNRIDIEQNPIDTKGDNIGDTTKFTESAYEYLARIFNFFNKKINRMSLVTSGLTGDMSEDKLNETCNKIFNLLPSYQNNMPFEWNSKVVCRETVSINDNEEQLNIITNINRIRGQIFKQNKVEDFSKIELAFDINTISENTELRFCTEDIKTFLDSAISIRERVTSEIFDNILG